MTSKDNRPEGDALSLAPLAGLRNGQVRCGAQLKKALLRDAPAIEAAVAQVGELIRAARDLEAKAKQIEDGVYDLKAVNPRRKLEGDTRTPEELLEIIAAKGQEVAEALAALRGSVKGV